jgi:hypothetical protein
MNIIDILKKRMSQWDARAFYLYSAAVIGGTLVICLFLGYYNHVKITDLEDTLTNLSEERMQVVLPMLTEAKKVQQQRDQVNEMLAQDVDFKIGKYLNELLSVLHITEKKREPSSTVREDGYLEVSLHTELIDMNMKQLAELLDRIEQNKRVYLKSINIVKSKRKADTIEVALTIGTLQSKAEVAE